MKKKTLKAIGTASLATIGVAAITIPTTLGLVSCTSGNDEGVTKPPVPAMDTLQAQANEIKSVPEAIKFMNELCTKYYTFSDFQKDLMHKFPKQDTKGSYNGGERTDKMCVESVSVNNSQTVNYVVHMEMIIDYPPDSEHPQETYEYSNYIMTYHNIYVKPVLYTDDNGNISMMFGITNPSKLTQTQPNDNVSSINEVVSYIHRATESDIRTGNVTVEHVNGWVSSENSNFNQNKIYSNDSSSMDDDSVIFLTPLSFQINFPNIHKVPDNHNQDQELEPSQPPESPHHQEEDINGALPPQVNDNDNQDSNDLGSHETDSNNNESNIENPNVPDTPQSSESPNSNPNENKDDPTVENPNQPLDPAPDHQDSNDLGSHENDNNNHESNIEKPNVSDTPPLPNIPNWKPSDNNDVITSDDGVKKPPVPAMKTLQAQANKIKTVPEAIQFMNELCAKYYTFSDFQKDLINKFPKQETKNHYDGGQRTDRMWLESISINNSQTINYVAHMEMIIDYPPDSGHPQETYEYSYYTMAYHSIYVKPILYADDNGNVSMRLGFSAPKKSVSSQPNANVSSMFQTMSFTNERGTKSEIRSGKVSIETMEGWVTSSNSDFNQNEIYSNNALSAIDCDIQSLTPLSFQINFPNLHK